MIQSYTRLKVADNTGAKEVMAIRIIGGAKQDAAKIGNLLIGTVKSATPHGVVKKKEVIRAVIVRQTQPLQRTDGTTIRFDDNALVILNPDGTPRGTRIFGPVARELRDLGYSKIISMATEVL